MSPPCSCCFVYLVWARCHWNRKSRSRRKHAEPCEHVPSWPENRETRLKEARGQQVELNPSAFLNLRKRSGAERLHSFTASPFTYERSGGIVRAFHGNKSKKLQQRFTIRNNHRRTEENSSDGNHKNKKVNPGGPSCPTNKHQTLCIQVWLRQKPPNSYI